MGMRVIRRKSVNVLVHSFHSIRLMPLLWESARTVTWHSMIHRLTSALTNLTSLLILIMLVANNKSERVGLIVLKQCPRKPSQCLFNRLLDLRTYFAWFQIVAKLKRLETV